MICSRVWAVIGRPHLRAVPVADAGVQHAQVVVDLGDRADGRARVLARRFLRDRDRRAQAADVVDVGLGHLPQELPGEAGQTLDVPPLPLGIQRVERQRALARAAHAGQANQLVARQRQDRRLRRLCSRAPWMTISEAGISAPLGGSRNANLHFMASGADPKRRRFLPTLLFRDHPQKTGTFSMTTRDQRLRAIGFRRWPQAGAVWRRSCSIGPVRRRRVSRSRGPSCGTTITARFRGPRTGDGSWTPQPKTWMPADWCFVHDGRCVVSAASSKRCRRGRWECFRSSGRIGIGLRGRSLRPQAMLERPLRVLNLFAYTGGSTLAAAAAGAEVVHIDAAQNIVDRATENAAFSGLAERPIRWIAEDAVKFCRRELKRGNQYDAVILDPPSYGHGPKGEPWKIDDRSVAAAGDCAASSRPRTARSCSSRVIRPASARRSCRPICRKASSAIAASRRRRASSRSKRATAASCRPASSPVGRREMQLGGSLALHVTDRAAAIRAGATPAPDAPARRAAR